jgi:hypothetical protein
MDILKHRGKFDLAIPFFLGFSIPWVGGSIYQVLGVAIVWHCLVALKTETIYAPPSQYGKGGYLNMEDNNFYFWLMFLSYVVGAILCFWHYPYKY